MQYKSIVILKFLSMEFQNFKDAIANFKLYNITSFKLYNITSIKLYNITTMKLYNITTLILGVIENINYKIANTHSVLLPL